SAPQNPPTIPPRLPPGVRNTASVAHQSADFSEFALRIDRGDCVPRRKADQLDAPAAEEGVAGKEERVVPLANKCQERCLDITARAGSESFDVRTAGRRRRCNIFYSPFSARSIG